MLKMLLCAGAVGWIVGLASPAQAAGQPTIPIIVKDVTAPYWQAVLAGARKASRDLGVNAPELGAQSESDVAGQIAILENAVAAKPAAIVIAPAEFRALGKPIDQAAKKVPIVAIDSLADSRAFAAFVGTDHVESGRIAADGLAQAIVETYGKAEGEVALIAAPPGAAARDQRVKGFKDELAAQYPGLRLVAEKVADSQLGAASVMLDLIAANSGLRGVFAASLAAGQGAGQAIADKQKAGAIKLVGFEIDDRLVGLLKDGAIYALVVQDPFRIGYDGVKTALAASKGEKVDGFVDAGATLVTKLNMDDDKPRALLLTRLK